MSRYAASKPSLRQAILGAAITDHGKVLTNVHWRLDNVAASDRGADLQATVVYLTLEYADQPTPGRITLQLTPEGIQQLKAFADPDHPLKVDRPQTAGAVSDTLVPTSTVSM